MSEQAFSQDDHNLVETVRELDKNLIRPLYEFRTALAMSQGDKPIHAIARRRAVELAREIDPLVRAYRAR